MKLYTTTKNSEGKKTEIGSNEMLTIEMNKGNRRMIEIFATIETIGENECLFVNMLNLSDGTTARIFEYEFYQKKAKCKKAKKCDSRK